MHNKTKKNLFHYLSPIYFLDIHTYTTERYSTYGLNLCQDLLHNIDECLFVQNYINYSIIHESYQLFQPNTFNNESLIITIQNILISNQLFFRT